MLYPSDNSGVGGVHNTDMYDLQRDTREAFCQQRTSHRPALSKVRLRINSLRIVRTLGYVFSDPATDGYLGPK